jgi:hypothetical protein
MQSVGYAPVQAPRHSVLERINLRMIAFTVIVMAMVGFPVYVYLDSAISGGIKDVGHGFKQVDLKAMSLYSFDQINGTLEDIPSKWRALDGQKVVLYGEMWSPLEAGDGRVGQFDLCYSIAKCCFSGPPQVQHFVKARTMRDAKLYYHPNQVKVTGILHVQVVRDSEANKVKEVYSMDVASVEPA